MADELKHLQAAADRANANSEKILSIVADLGVRLQVAIDSGNPAAVQAVADALDAESVRMEAAEGVTGATGPA